MTSAQFTVFAVEGIPEIVPGDDLIQLIGDLVALEDGDILAITSKIVSKAEGRFAAFADREEAITSETVRVVATRAYPGGVTRIVENRFGMVMAAAGVDASNVPDGLVLLLPTDPDASARRIALALRERFRVSIGVIITDTFGRPWREGQTDVAIGAAGLRVLDDLRGTRDADGRELSVTIAATADEVAGAVDLVKGKSRGLPLAIVRGLGHLVGEMDEPGATALVRPRENDMFSLGTEEAWAEGFEAGRRAKD
ncbi:coenzyme F420-0:L-glutamate ligase [Pseudarthrobacter sp. fls2-241-R2A-168]|uniref:coenzyme F420-0:L-glutamate ligase n=1 Tax=Pseudarthrobacter sp. fls2-241-R2A-168 TaxID=3040304 RepID=UPI002556CA7E|nr:coenzyme F420-0:L-glutamate ligase [Pseudarthrobacter sp. fls2-241-R2A-168]